MNDRHIYAGAILAAVSLTVSCILVTGIILARNAGYDIQSWVAFVLIAMALLLVTGIFTIIYRLNTKESAESTPAVSAAK